MMTGKMRYDRSGQTIIPGAGTESRRGYEYGAVHKDE